MCKSELRCVNSRMSNVQVARHRIRVRSSRSGRCFELCGRGIMNDRTWMLVHGTIHGWIAHAWLERDGVCYDAVLDSEQPQGAYYAAREAVAEARYSQREAAEKAANSNHWGPWHNSAGTVQSGPIRRRE